MFKKQLFSLFLLTILINLYSIEVISNKDKNFSKIIKSAMVITNFYDKSSSKYKRDIEFDKLFEETLIKNFNDNYLLNCGL